jgi:hypothetical protein
MFVFVNDGVEQAACQLPFNKVYVMEKKRITTLFLIVLADMAGASAILPIIWVYDPGARREGKHDHQGTDHGKRPGGGRAISRRGVPRLHVFEYVAEQ